MSDYLGRGYGKLYLSGRDDRVPQLAHISLVDGRNNTKVGLMAGESFSLQGGNCVLVGAYAGHNAIAESSTFLGAMSGRTAQRIKSSVFCGHRSGEMAERVEGTTMLGALSGRRLKRANNNTILGYSAGAELTSGSRNCLVGSYSGYSQYNAYDNVCIGHQSGFNNRTGSNNCYIGTNSGYAASSGFENVCIGVGSGQELSVGQKNVLCGYLAGRKIAGASNCIAIGTQAMEFFSNGDTNTCLGTGTARRFTGTNNTILGGYSAGNAIGNFTTVVGARSMNRRNGGRVNLSNCVIVGENVQFDIPVRNATVGVAEMAVAPDVFVENTDNTLLLTNTDVLSGRALIPFNSAPVGDHLTINNEYLRLGDVLYPLQLDISAPGTYDISYGSTVENNQLTRSIPVRLHVEITPSSQTFALILYETEEVVLTPSRVYTGRYLDVVVEQFYDTPRIRVRMKPGGAGDWDIDTTITNVLLPGAKLDIDPVVDVDSSGMMTVYVRNGIDAVALGSEVEFIDTPYEQVNASWRVTAIGAPEEGTGAVPLTFGCQDNTLTDMLGSQLLTAESALRASRVISASNVSIVVYRAKPTDPVVLRVTAPSIGGMSVSGKKEACAVKVLIDSPVISGLRKVVNVVNMTAGIFDVEPASEDTLVVGNTFTANTVTIGTFEPPATAVEVVATGAKKSINNFVVHFAQRADADLVRSEIYGPLALDGHKHRGTGTQAQMDIDIRRRYLTFPVSNPAGSDTAADYSIGATNIWAEANVTFDMPPTTTFVFGIQWLNSYRLECINSPSQTGFVVTHFLDNNLSTKVVEVTNSNVMTVNGELVLITQDDGVVRESELPMDLTWIRGENPGVTPTANVSFYQSQSAFNVVFEVSAQTRSQKVIATLNNAPLFRENGGTISFFSTGATKATNIAIKSLRYRDVPEFSECIFLGPNFVITEEIDRNNVFIASLGQDRLLRANTDEFRCYSKKFTANATLLEGTVYTGNTVNPTMTIKGSKLAGATTSGDALLVQGNVTIEGPVSLTQLASMRAAAVETFVAATEFRGAVNALAPTNAANRWFLRHDLANPTEQFGSVIWALELEKFVATTTSGIALSSNGRDWTYPTVPAGNYWASVAWSPQLRLLVVTGQNAAMSSEDGVTWTLRTVAEYAWVAVAWAPEKAVFVAIALEPYAMISQDGLTWTRFPTPAIAQCRALAWSPAAQRFTALGQNVAMTSIDGQTWTLASGVAVTTWNSIAWSPELGTFAAVGENPDTTRPTIATSTDGISWTPYNPINIQWNPNWTTITWIPEWSRFVGLGLPGLMLQSSDGETWEVLEVKASKGISVSCWSSYLQVFLGLGTGTSLTSYTPTTPYETTATTARAITLDIDEAAGLYAPTRDTLGISIQNTDVLHIDKTQLSLYGYRFLTQPNPIADFNWSSVAYSPVLDLFVAIAVETSEYGVPVALSANAREWDVGTAFIPTDEWLRLLWVEELGKFVATGVTYVSATSPDGITWTTHGTNPGYSITDIAWSPYLELLVATNATEDGGILTSPDGITWTEQNGAPNCQSVVWSPDLQKFVAMRTNLGFVSSDGITWTPMTIYDPDWIPGTPDIVPVWFSVAWSPELRRFAAVGTGVRTYQRIAFVSSSDGVTWSPGTYTSKDKFDGDDEWRVVTWSPDLHAFVAFGEFNVATSADGQTWVIETLYTRSVFRKSLIWAKGMFVTVGEAGDEEYRIMTTGYGMAAAPAVSLGTTQTTGMYSDAIDALGFSIQGVERLRISPGNVRVQGKVTANSFQGDGSELTNIQAINIVGLATELTANIENIRANSVVSEYMTANVVLNATALNANGSGLSGLNASNVTTGLLAVTRGGTGTNSSTGTGSLVLNISPVFQGVMTTASISGSNDIQTTGRVAAGTTGYTGTATLYCLGSAQITGDVTTGSVSGDGAGLSNLNMANTASGTLAVVRGGTGVGTSTGTGSVVLNNGPSFSGTVTASIINATTLSGDGAGLSNLNMANTASGTLAVVRGGTGVGTSTGTGSVVLNNGPSFSGTVTASTINATTLSGSGAGITNLNMSNAASGTLAVARGGTGVGTSTGTGSVVLNNSPSFSGTASFGAINCTTLSSSSHTYVGAGLYVGGRQFTSYSGSVWYLGDIETNGPFSIGNAGSNKAFYLNTTSTSGTAVVIDASNRVARQGSSLRYKRNVRYMTDEYINAVWKLKPALFQYRPNEYDAVNNRQCAGFIAEDIHESAFYEGLFYDTQGRPDSLDTMGLLSVTIGALQQLRREVAVLRQRIEVLEGSR